MRLRCPGKHQEAVKEGRVVSTNPPLTLGSCSPLQLELLEARRAEVLNEKAFCIQCCWRRFKEKKTAKEKRSATLIQAGDLWGGDEITEQGTFPITLGDSSGTSG